MHALSMLLALKDESTGWGWVTWAVAAALVLIFRSHVVALLHSAIDWAHGLLGHATGTGTSAASLTGDDAVAEAGARHGHHAARSAAASRHRHDAVLARPGRGAAA